MYECRFSPENELLQFISGIQPSEVLHVFSDVSIDVYHLQGSKDLMISDLLIREDVYKKRRRRHGGPHTDGILREIHSLCKYVVGVMIFIGGVLLFFYCS
jgi:hypothetical protein